MDEDFFYNWKNAKDAGIPRGGYHFLRWDISGLLQARIFCDLLKDDPGELPPVCDFEAPIKDGKYPSNAMLAQFLEAVETIMREKAHDLHFPGLLELLRQEQDHRQVRCLTGPIIRSGSRTTPPPAPRMIPEPWKSVKCALVFLAAFKHTGDGLKFGPKAKALI